MAKERYKYEKIYNNKGVYKKNGKIDETGKKRRKYGGENCGKKQVGFIAEDIKPTSILDVGCGHNKFCIMMNKRGIKSIGVDCACPKADIIADAESLPFKNNEYDLITAFDLLEHIPEEEIDLVLQEFKRVSNKFMYQIALRQAPSRIDNEKLHPCVKSIDWWIAKIKQNEGEIAHITYHKKGVPTIKSRAKKLLVYGFFAEDKP